MKLILKPVILAVTIITGTSFFAYPKEKLGISENEQTSIFNEAEDWIDDMPEGYQDMKSDAILHAMHGFSSEIQRYREFKPDTTDFSHYEVRTTELSNSAYPSLSIKLFSGKEKDKENKPLLIYIHGGGWNMGSIGSGENFCRALANNGEIDVVAIEYLLAPENPYPSGLNSCIGTIREIIKKGSEWGISTERINIGGSGAGGNLAILSALKLNEGNDGYNINSVVVYYPILKASIDKTKPNWKKYAKGYGLDSRFLESALNSYLNGISSLNNGEDNSLNNKEDSILWPVNLSEDDLENLPSLLIIEAGRDILIEQEKDFIARLQSKNKNIEEIEFKGAIHGFIEDGKQKSAFKKAVELTESFLTNQ